MTEESGISPASISITKSVIYFRLPTDLEDVSKYPNLIAKLLEKGYSESDVKKILGENFLRVFEKVEEVRFHWLIDLYFHFSSGCVSGLIHYKHTFVCWGPVYFSKWLPVSGEVIHCNLCKFSLDLSDNCGHR